MNSEKIFTYFVVMMILINGIISVFNSGTFIWGLFLIIVACLLWNGSEKHFKKEEDMRKNGWIEISTSFYINEKNETVKINNNEYRFDQILSSELIQDEKTVSSIQRNLKNKTNSKSSKPISVGRAIVGGTIGTIATGGAGALAGGIIGGLSGKKKTTGVNVVNEITNMYDYDICTTLLIKVRVDSMTNPYELFDLIHTKINKSSLAYRMLYERALKIQGVLENIIFYTQNKK